MSQDKEKENVDPKESEELSAEDLEQASGGAFDAFQKVADFSKGLT